MGKRNIILFSFLVSCLIHALVFSFVVLRIEGRQSPFLYSWQDILSKKDLLISRDSRLSLPQGVNFPSHDLRKKYFSQDFLNRYFYKFLSANAIYPSMALSDQLREKTLYFYLWERPSAIYSQIKEKASYMVFVSGRGKVVFSFPQALSSNSRNNILTQEYVREAANFLEDRFLWTKLEGVVE